MTQFVVILTYMTQFFVIYKAYAVVLLFMTYMTRFFVIYNVYDTVLCYL